MHQDLAGTLIGLTIDDHQAFVADSHQAEGRAPGTAYRGFTRITVTAREQRGSYGFSCGCFVRLTFDNDGDSTVMVFIETFEHGVWMGCRRIVVVPGLAGFTVALWTGCSSPFHLRHDIAMFEDHALLQVKNAATAAGQGALVHGQSNRNIHIGESYRIEIDAFAI